MKWWNPRSPRPTTNGTLVHRLANEFLPHLANEDRVLFPAIWRLYQGRADSPFGSVANRVRMMTAEHETVGDVLRGLRETTRAYEVPDDGCTSDRLLYERLDALESDTHLHVFKENSVLFPAAVDLEASSTPANSKTRT